MTTFRRIAAGLVGIAALAVAAPAQASSTPTRDHVTIDDTFRPPRLSAACGFDVTRHVVGTVDVLTSFDASGNLVRELDTFHLVETVSANGHVLTGRTNQLARVTVTAGGDWSVDYSGTDFRLTIPGQGISFGSAGHLGLDFNANDDLVGVQESGSAVADFTAICTALSPALSG